MRADLERLTDTLKQLVATESVNPGFGGGGEARIAGVTAGLLGDAGLEVRRYEAEPGRPSVVGRLPGTGTAPALMLNAHYDTVGVEGMERPFEPVVSEGRLYGRGAFDMKGALAACIEAARLLAGRGQPLGGDLLVTAVADEEVASLGTADLLERRRNGELAFEAAIVTEPTGLELCVAHRGFTWIEITTRGRAAHGSRYREGVDANLRMGRVLRELEGLLAELQSRTGHPLLGPPSLHAARIGGGVGISTYSPSCTLEVERRTVPPESREDVEREIAGLLDRLRAEDPSLEVEWRTLLHREPFETSPDAPIASAVRDAAAGVLGRAPRIIGDAPWMDSALLAAEGVDTVVMGPGGAGAHAEVEWADLASCVSLAEILARSATRFLGGG